MLTLLTFPGSFGSPSHSPYCVKAMCLLTMAGEDWTPEYLERPADMPYGKLPVLRHDGRLIPDSGRIQAFLEARGVEFHPDLSPVQRATARAFQRLAEESLSLGLVHERWLNDSCWVAVRDVFFGAIPEAQRVPATDAIRDQVRAGMIAHGFSRMGDADRLAVLREDLAAIEAMLWEGPFLFGDKPTAADASTVPILHMLSNLPGDSALGDLMKGNTRLQAYVAAARAAIYPTLKAKAAAA